MQTRSCRPQRSKSRPLQSSRRARGSAGQEGEALTQHIEPNLVGAAWIARAFANAAIRLGVPMAPC